jgi:adenylate cyclase
VSSAPSTSQPAVASRLSIVVLPFTNLSDDREQQYFADGITEDLTTDLSRIAYMFVIARNTAFTYRNKPVDAKQIGRELGVRYLLEGSVRRSGNQVRINAQLVSTETGAHLWAERFDRDTGDLFALQNEITSRIAVALDVALIRAEAARPAQHRKAADYIFRGRAALHKPPSRDTFLEAIDMFEHALALDPQSFEVKSWLAIVLTGNVLNQWTKSPAADIAQAERLVGQALAVAPRSLVGRWAKGQLLRAQHRNEEAILEYEMIIALNPNAPHAYAELGRCKFYTGSIAEMIPLVEQAISLSPRDARIGNWYYRIGAAHLLQSRTGDAILWLQKARNANPGLPHVHAHLAAAYALNGDAERGAAELAEARRFSGDDRYLSIVHLKAVGDFGVPKVRALFEATYFAGLRKAGMPEE